MQVLVVSGRADFRHLADACAYDAEDVIVSSLGADLFTSETDERTLASRYDLVIVVGVSFINIRDLLYRLFTRVRRRVEGPVLGYVFGAYGSLVAKNWRQTIRRRIAPRTAWSATIDRLYLGIADDVDQIADCLNVQTRYLPMAANVLGVAARPYRSIEDRPIALNAFGRQKEDIVNAFCDHLNRPCSGDLAYYTNFITSSGAIDMTRYRAMFWQLLRLSRLSTAFDHFFANQGQARLSYVGPRWFEALAAGTVVIGRAPDTVDRAQLLDWQDAAVDLSPDPKRATEELIALLEDNERIRAASRRNLVEMSRRHDWGHRLLEMLSVEGFEAPQSLTERLRRLDANAVKLLGANGIRNGDVSGVSREPEQGPS